MICQAPNGRLPEPSDRERDGVLSIADFGALRAEMSGVRIPLYALENLVAAEPGLAERLERRILPTVVRLGRELRRDLDLFEGGRAGRVVLDRRTVAGWVAHLLLGTLAPAPEGFPSRDTTLLLVSMVPAENAKLRCVLAYFDRLANGVPPGSIEIERLVGATHDTNAWSRDRSPLGALEVQDVGAIEDADGFLQVDFANRYLGGGVLSGGNVQEEIRFAIAPELLVGMIVSPVMGPTDAVVLRGTERFALTEGYGGSLRFAGDFADPCTRKTDGGADVDLVAIDAIDFRKGESLRLLGQANEPAAILRELAKARAGFTRDPRNLAVATGNWGCGVFGGDPAYKAVIQWLAASAEGRAVRYYPFGDRRVGDLAGFARRAQGAVGTVGALFDRLMESAGCDGRELYARLAP